MKLSKYNPKAKCPKCGYDDVRTIYHHKDRCKYSCARDCPEPLEVEHFGRYCQRCYYNWSEGVLK